MMKPRATGFTSRGLRTLAAWFWISHASLAIVPTAEANPCPYPTIDLPASPTYEDTLQWAFAWERETWARIAPNDPISPVALNKPALPGGRPYWPALVHMSPVDRALRQMQDLLERLADKGVVVASEHEELERLRCKAQASTAGGLGNQDSASAERVYREVRMAKRRLLLRDPDLNCLTRILFVKRFPYEPSHNYTDIMDSPLKGGGGVFILDMPRSDGRLEPSLAKTTLLFDAGNGIARDPVADFDAQTIFFAYRPPGSKGEVYWHLMSMKADGTDPKELTSGRFHDYYPCPLPDGGLTFVSTRISCRFLCFIPMAFTLHRSNADGGNIETLSYSNISEWGPSIMSDGRILWTHSEYQDKGANFGHTLWAIRPDGTQPELVYGNDTRNCMMNGYEIPETGEISCVMVSHFGDFNGPIALINPEDGQFNKDAVTNITPDVAYGYDGHWGSFGNKIGSYPDRRCFRDPIPISRDYLLVSHSPSGDWNSPSHRFGLYLIDRYGNRELLYLDLDIGSMAPTPLRPRPRPPVIASVLPGRQPRVSASTSEQPPTGQFILTDVYQGLTPPMPRGAVKHLRICEELKSLAQVRSDGKLREEYEQFTDFYASPIFHRSNSPNAGQTDVVGPCGWTTYVAKGVEGLVPVEPDGSARFTAPARKVLYFQALDENLNELQRMRSVVQLQPGETRSCIGCHESRNDVPDNRRLAAMKTPPHSPQPPPWGSGPFSYEKVVQAVLDMRCASCHNARHEKGIDLTGTRDANKVPASYRTLITKGLVNYANCGWGEYHDRTVPMTIGTVKSRVIDVLNKGHHDVRLSRDEMHALKCWIDLNCPLWADYQDRTQRQYPTTQTAWMETKR
ncbi:MAG: hypothetical protein KA354_17695 [Phycisphaerae bacterium]|nr:hypothetical protein [Phycisphaerae bacterium]